MSRKLPWAKFSFADYERDPNLRKCSLAAQGLWMRMLCSMDASPQRGYLLDGANKATTPDIALMVGYDRRLVDRLIRILESHSVFSRDARGVIFSRRMIRDDVRMRKHDAISRDPDAVSRHPDAVSRDPDAERRQDGRGVSKNNNTVAQIWDNPPEIPEGAQDRDSESESDLESKQRRKKAHRSPAPRQVVPEVRPRSHNPSRAKADISAARDQPAASQLVTFATPGLTPPALATAVAAWNTLASAQGLPTVQRVSEARQRALVARLRECGGIDGWHAALGKVAASAFLLGRVGRGWKVDFDFLVQPAAFMRLLEGSYDQAEVVRAKSNGEMLAETMGFSTEGAIWPAGGADTDGDTIIIDHGGN